MVPICTIALYFSLLTFSVARLSNQFKQITGLTPSHFKKFKKNRQLGLVNP
jgi:hypothetical protein